MTTGLQQGPQDTGPHSAAGSGLAQAPMTPSEAGDRPQLPSSPVRLARIAGLLYLMVAILGGFAQVVRVKVYEPGDAAATAANIVANATLVRLSFVADLVQALL